MKFTQNFLLKVVLLLIWLGSILYALIYYAGLRQDGEMLAKTIHMGINIAVFVILIVLLRKLRRLLIPKSITIWLFFGFVLLMSINSLIQLHFRDVVPSLFRFLNYFAVFLLVYNYHHQKGIQYYFSAINFFLKISILSCLGFGYVEIFLNDIQYLNGAFRLAGSFKFHQLANGMYLFVLITSILFLKIDFRKKPIKTTLYVIAFLLLTYLFLRVHSRMLTLSLFGSLILVYFFKFRTVISKINLGILTSFSAVLAILLILNTDIQPRLKEALKSDKMDSSSKTRVDIISNSFNHLDNMELLSGIGLGRFNLFYYQSTGKKGVAAHNNYLLFLTEGGILSMIIFFAFQIIILVNLIRLIKRGRDNPSNLSFRLILISATLFLGIEVMGFLLNNYYFYQSEIIIWLFMGGALAQLNINNYELGRKS